MGRAALFILVVLAVSWIGGGCFVSPAAASSRYDGMSDAELLLAFRDMVDDTAAGCLQATWPETAAAGNISDHCSWHGVHCGGSTGQQQEVHVERLDLSNCLLEQVAGAQSEAFAPLCSLPHLTYLDLTNNNLYGSFPAALLNCTKLRHLGLSANLLVGGLPEGIGERLKDLELLDLSQNNRFSGAVPAELATLPNLTVVSLSHNLFSGSIPPAFGDLRHLSELHLDHNNLTGQIPSSLASCSELAILDLSDNALSSSIPASLGNLPAIDVLNLSHNQLTGRIPERLSDLRLTNLDLSYNLLTGPVPSAFLHSAFDDSFVGNADLCGDDLVGILPCDSRSGSSHSRARQLLTVRQQKQQQPQSTSR